MDTLVARYSRPAFEQNEPFQDEAEDFTNPVPSISLKFAMPPISQVRR
jgi:20S proteasome subunit beta 5